MRPAVEITDATEDDARELSLTLRQADAEEIRALGHPDPLPPLLAGVRTSDWSKAARVDGQLACVFGLSHTGTVLAVTGTPWLIGTPALATHARMFMRASAPYIAQMLRQYPCLVNVVHAPNTQAVRWLRRMGFALGQARPMGPLHEPFHVFTMRA